MKLEFKYFCTKCKQHYTLSYIEPICIFCLKETKKYIKIIAKKFEK